MKKPAYSKKSLAFFVLSILVLWGICAFILLDGKAKAPACNEQYRKDKVAKIDNKAIKVEVASSASQQEKGLGGKSCIGAGQGMLFVYDKPDYYECWMKDMRFPIDIIWISTNHKVVMVEENVQPSTFPDTFRNSKLAQYVLEISAGSSKDLGIKEGTSINF